MRLVRLLINVTLFITAKVVLRVDGQGTTEDSDPSNDLSIPALDPFNQDPTVLPVYSVAALDSSNQDSTVHPENFATGDSPNPLYPDLSSSTANSRTCADNLGKREDTGFTLGNSPNTLYVLCGFKH